MRRKKIAGSARGTRSQGIFKGKRIIPAGKGAREGQNWLSETG